MHALVHVGFGGGDIVLESAGDGFEHVVDDTQHIVAAVGFVHYNAEGAEVKYTVYIYLLGVHLSVDGVDMLYAAEDGGLHIVLIQSFLNLGLHVVHEGFKILHLIGQSIGYLFVACGVEILQGAVLQLPLGPLHTKTVCQRCVNLHGLQGFAALLCRGLVVHGAHIVHTVGNFDEDNADVLGHGHEHLAQVLHLLVFLAGVLHSCQLGNALDNVCHRNAEALGHILVDHVRVLDNIVQQRGHDGVFIQTHIHGYVRRGNAVGHIG